MNSIVILACLLALGNCASIPDPTPKNNATTSDAHEGSRHARAVNGSEPKNITAHERSLDSILTSLLGPDGANATNKDNLNSTKERLTRAEPTPAANLTTPLSRPARGAPANLNNTTPLPKVNESPAKPNATESSSNAPAKRALPEEGSSTEGPLAKTTFAPSGPSAKPKAPTPLGSKGESDSKSSK